MGSSSVAAKIKSLKNIDSLSELPFYEELSVVKTNNAFRAYAMTYKVELIDKKDHLSHKFIIKCK